MTDPQLTLEIWKLIVSTLTPLLVIIFGVVVARKLEKNKLEALKKKEWQVKWAELFFNQATEFNDNTSKIICDLFNLQNEKDQEIIDKKYQYLHEKYSRNLEIDWNIQNYAQFSETFKNEVINAQQTLMDSISEIIKNRGGSLEEFRKKLFKYNEAVRKAHSEILKMR